MESVQEKYASALFSLAKEQNKVEKYQQEAGEIYLSFHENEGVVHLLASYFITEKEKDQVIDKVFGSIDLPDLLSFIKVICANSRAYLLLSILRTFNKKCNEYFHISEGIVYSANKLTAEEIEDIEKAISVNLSAKVRLTNEIDKSLIGGIKVIVGGKVFDKSIKSTLEGMRKALIKGGE